MPIPPSVAQPPLAARDDLSRGRPTFDIILRDVRPPANADSTELVEVSQWLRGYIAPEEQRIA